MHHVNVCEFGVMHSQCRCTSKDKAVVRIVCNMPRLHAKKPKGQEMSVTAKVKVFKSAAYGDDVRLDFVVDYSDGRHKEWATATPVFNLMMYVKSEVAENFEHGAAYTVTFTPEDSA